MSDGLGLSSWVLAPHRPKYQSFGAQAGLYFRPTARLDLTDFPSEILASLD